MIGGNSDLISSPISNKCNSSLAEQDMPERRHLSYAEHHMSQACHAPLKLEPKPCGRSLPRLRKQVKKTCVAKKAVRRGRGRSQFNSKLALRTEKLVTKAFLEEAKLVQSALPVTHKKVLNASK